jgi:hypothetical protein
MRKCGNDYFRVQTGALHCASLCLHCVGVICPPGYGPPTAINNRFEFWAHCGEWEKCFELSPEMVDRRTADDPTPPMSQLIARQGRKGRAKAGRWPFARRAKQEDSPQFSRFGWSNLSGRAVEMHAD